MSGSPKKKSKPSLTPANKTEESSFFGRLLRQLARTLNVVSLLPVAIVAVAPWVSPAQWWLPTIAALFFPFQLIIPFIWIFLWLKFSKRWALFNLLILLLHYPYWEISYRLPPAPLKQSPEDIRVVSMNVRAFDYQFESLKKTTAFLKAHDPEIICLQEFRNELDHGHKALPYLRKVLGLKKYAFVELLQDAHYGLLILSKFPITKYENLSPEKNSSNGLMYADLKLYGQTLRVYNLHLESYNFSLAQRRFLEGNLAQNVNARKSSRKHNLPNTPQGFWKMCKVILKASKQQAEQAAAYLSHLETAPKPDAIITCGDLNNPPYNYFYRVIKGRLKDCFVEQGVGMGKTYGKGLAAFRIDYIFSSPKMRIIQFETVDATGISDHHAVVTRLRFPN